jgi:hypothetical protein
MTTIAAREPTHAFELRDRFRPYGTADNQLLGGGIMSVERCR